MSAHQHVFVWTIRGKGVLVQRCACGTPGPLKPIFTRPPRRS